MPTPIEILDRFLVILEDDDPVRITLEALRDGVELKDPRATEEARIILEDWVKNRPKEEKSFTEVIDSALERTLEAKRMERAGFGYYGEPNGRTRDDTQVAKGDGVRRPKIFRSDSDTGDNEPPRTEGSSLAEYSRSLEGSGEERGKEQGLYGEVIGKGGQQEEGEAEGGEPVGGVGRGMGGVQKRLSGLTFDTDGASVGKIFGDIGVHELLDDIPYDGADDELYAKGRVNAPINLDPFPHLPGLELDHKKVAGCDCASYGDDKTVITVRYGPHIIDIQRYSNMDPMEIVGYLLIAIEEHKLEEIVIDITGGLGYGVSSRLKELDISEKVTITEVEFQRSPRDDSLKVRNQRSEIFYLLKERFMSGQISLPPDRDLLEELGYITYKPTSTGLLEITSKDIIKKNLNRSPDAADSLGLCFFDIGDLEVY